MQSTNTHPRESMEFHLILLSELPVHRSESGLLSREFLVEVTDVAGRFLNAKVKVGCFEFGGLKGYARSGGSMEVESSC